MSFELFGRTFNFLADERQITKAVNMLEKYILKPEILLLVLVFAVYFVLRCYCRLGKKDTLSRLLKNISPLVYLFLIFMITVFNRESGVAELRLHHDRWFTSNGFHESNVLGFLFNVAVYVPFGYLLYKYLNASRRIILTIFVVCAASILIETLQYTLARGVTSVDDLFANIIGGVLGLSLAIVLEKFKKRESME